MKARAGVTARLVQSEGDLKTVAKGRPPKWSLKKKSPTHPVWTLTIVTRVLNAWEHVGLRLMFGAKLFFPLGEWYAVFEGYGFPMSRASFCYNKKLHLFLTKVAKSCIFAHKHFKRL